MAQGWGLKLREFRGRLKDHSGFPNGSGGLKSTRVYKITGLFKVSNPETAEIGLKTMVWEPARTGTLI